MIMFQWDTGFARSMIPNTLLNVPPAPIQMRPNQTCCCAPLHAPRQQWRKDFLHKLRTVMDTVDTPDDMQELLHSQLKCYLFQQAPSQISIPESVAHMAQSQHQIGWSQLIQGQFSDAWRHHYQQYLGSKTTK